MAYDEPKEVQRRECIVINEPSRATLVAGWFDRDRDRRYIHTMASYPFPDPTMNVADTLVSGRRVGRRSWGRFGCSARAARRVVVEVVHTPGSLAGESIEPLLAE
jgi:hypothetical protein